MDHADQNDPDMIELVIQLCTRIGMMMEDVTPIALDASRDGLEQRVTELVRATRAMAAIAISAEALLGR